RLLITITAGPSFSERRLRRYRRTTGEMSTGWVSGENSSSIDLGKEGRHQCREVFQARGLQGLKFLLRNLYVFPLFASKLVGVFAPADGGNIFTKNVHVFLALRFKEPMRA